MGSVFSFAELSILLLVEEIYPCLLSIYYAIINEIYANKPRCLRLGEAIGGFGGQTNFIFT